MLVTLAEQNVGVGVRDESGCDLAGGTVGLAAKLRESVYDDDVGLSSLAAEFEAVLEPDHGVAVAGESPGFVVDDQGVAGTGADELVDGAHAGEQGEAKGSVVGSAA